MLVAFRVLILVAGVLAPLLLAGEPAHARETVQFRDYPAGTVVVKTSQRRLYYVLGDGRAIRYPVGVGRAGKAWAGEGMISQKRLRPAWSPPAEIRRDKPGIPDVIPAGSPRNPMGAAALLLGGTEYAIHGTNSPGSIGGFVSYGCIRMHNRDILDLYDRVHIGTRVVVMR
jgi:lipoprotein-anchoring transpeptidase ErfK/SrfK